LKPFIIYTKSIYERGRRYRHRITQESDQVNQVVGRARNQLISDDRYEQMMGPAATGGGFSKINAAAG